MATIEIEVILICSLYQVLFHKMLIMMLTTKVLTLILHKIYLPFLINKMPLVGTFKKV